MSNTAVFADANVVIEASLPARKQTEKARRYLASHPTVISPLSAHLLVYVGIKAHVPFDLLLRMLKTQHYTQFGSDEIQWALANHENKDFEDALQVACAVIHGCRQFVTFDRVLTKRYGQFIDIRVL